MENSCLDCKWMTLHPETVASYYCSCPVPSPKAVVVRSIKNDIDWNNPFKDCSFWKVRDETLLSLLSNLIVETQETNNRIQALKIALQLRMMPEYKAKEETEE